MESRNPCATVQIQKSFVSKQGGDGVRVTSDGSRASPSRGKEITSCGNRTLLRKESKFFY